MAWGVRVGARLRSCARVGEEEEGWTWRSIFVTSRPRHALRGQLRGAGRRGWCFLNHKPRAHLGSGRQTGGAPESFSAAQGTEIALGQGERTEGSPGGWVCAHVSV